jgi:mannitol-1-phosphate/altronate dehydrogenase
MSGAAVHFGAGNIGRATSTHRAMTEKQQRSFAKQDEPRRVMARAGGRR